MELQKLLTETIAYLRQSLQLTKKGVPDSVKESAAKFNEFIENKLFADNPKAVKALKAFKEHPESGAARNKLEVRLEDALEEKNLRSELEKFIDDFAEIQRTDYQLQHRFENIIDDLSEIHFKGADQQSKLNNIIAKLSELKEESAMTEVISDEDTETSESTGPEKIASDKVAEIASYQRSKNTILVPWDFSKVAEFAFQHAVQYAEIIGGQITLLHIVKKEKDTIDAFKNLNKVAEKFNTTYNIKPTAVVKAGNIFTTITDVASDVEAKFVVMGTHGIKGIQKFTGSWALKVIAHTNSPFVVVQAPPAHKSIETVIFPVDYRREIKQKLNQAKFLSTFYNLKYFITLPEHYTSSDIEHKTKNNLRFIQAYFNKYDIDFEITHVEGTKDFADATIKFAKETNPDLIMILTTKGIASIDYILGAEEQKIIANDAKIPVMCVNPLPGGRWTYTSTGG